MIREQLNTDTDALLDDSAPAGSIMPSEDAALRKKGYDYSEQVVADNVQNNLMPSATKSPSVDAVLAGIESANEYTDEKVAEALSGIFRIAGNYDASVGTFPTTGTGTEGAVRSGDVYIVSVAGTLGGVSYSVNDRFYALVDEPGQTSANWDRFSFNPDEATDATLGTVRYASDAEVTDGTGNGVVSAQQLQEKLDNLPAPEPSALTVGNVTATNLFTNAFDFGVNTLIGSGIGGARLPEDKPVGYITYIFFNANGVIQGNLDNTPSIYSGLQTNVVSSIQGTAGQIYRFTFTKNGRWIYEIISDVPKYKSYVALISQSGTSAPTATVISNELSGTPSFTRIGPGQYSILLTGAFTVGKTFSPQKRTCISSSANYDMTVLAGSQNFVSLESLANGVNADDIFDETFIEIRVYN